MQSISVCTRVDVPIIMWSSRKLLSHFAGYLGCQLQISTIKLLEVIRIRNVARADTILTVLHDDVDGKSIKLLPNG